VQEWKTKLNCSFLTVYASDVVSFIFNADQHVYYPGFLGPLYYIWDLNLQ